MDVEGERPQKEAPLYIKLFLLGFLSYYLIAFIVPVSVKLILIFLTLLGCLYIVMEEDDYTFLGFYIFLLPLLLFRSVWLIPGLLLLSVIFMLVIFFILQQPRVLPIVTEYRIPKEATPAEAAFLLSKDIGPQELMATIYSLYLKGYIDIEEKGSQIYLKVVRDYQNDETLLPYEKFLLNRIFIMPNVDIMVRTGIVYKYENFPDSVDIELVLKNLPDWVNNFRKTLLDSLKYQKPIFSKFAFEIKPVFLTLAVVYFMSGITIIGILRQFYDYSKVMEVSILVETIVASIIFVFISFMHFLPLTRFGEEVYSKVRGFAEFMERVEKPRLAWLIKEEKMNVFELLCYLYALNLLNPIRWVLELIKDAPVSKETLLFNRLLTKIHLRWFNVGMSGQE